MRPECRLRWGMAAFRCHWGSPLRRCHALPTMLVHRTATEAPITAHGADTTAHHGACRWHLPRYTPEDIPRKIYHRVYHREAYRDHLPFPSSRVHTPEAEFRELASPSPALIYHGFTRMDEWRKAGGRSRWWEIWRWSTRSDKALHRSLPSPTSPRGARCSTCSQTKVIYIVSRLVALG